MRLIFGHDAEVAAWVAAQIPHMHSVPPQYAAIGVERDGAIIAGIVYHNYTPQYGGLEISMAAISPRWATRGTIRALLHYPFCQLGCRWVLTCIPHDNARAIKLNKGLGFIQRGVLPDFYAEKRHAVLLTMPAKAYGRLFA